MGHADRRVTHFLQVYLALMHAGPNWVRMIQIKTKKHRYLDRISVRGWSAAVGCYFSAHLLYE